MFDSLRHSRIIARLAAVAAVALLTSGAQSSCSAGDPSLLPPRDLPSGDGPTFSTTLRIKNSAGEEDHEFRRLELMTFELTIRNRTAQTVTVSLSTPNDSDFFVFRNGADQPLWNARQGSAFPTVVTPYVFAPLETKVISFTWNQEQADGTFLNHGNYEVRGAIMGVGVLPTPLASNELASTLEAFQVN